jgi:alpha-L-arabinofuranosidase
MLLAAGAAVAQTVKIAVQVDKPGPRISPLLYGLFFEEINRAGDGGLYAEMIQNRSFEDDRGGDEAVPAKMPGWTLVTRDGVAASIAIDASHPLGPTNPNALRLDVGNAPAVRAGVANEGFKGIAVRKGSQYQFSMYARAGNGLKGPVTVGIQDSFGTVATTAISGLDAEWKRFDAVLTAGTTTTTAQLVIGVASPGTLWIDQVSLFPKDTWHGRPNGLRPDLGEMLHAMRPAFVRFPGGCYVEGNKLPNAFRWKQTIGDLAGRPGHWNLWGYRSTDGLGYHEYLQMCEDLGAEPLFVINCGMSHVEMKVKGVAVVPDLAEYLQDALDAIEYANGPADSKWGALRAKAGHPAPFNLKYMEIGNENGGPTYDKHYALFYQAIKAKYPQMNLVANTMTRPGPVDIDDEHYYSSPEFFMANAAKYDKYRRDAQKVYVGEYAVTQGAGKGNLRAAVGEAAFMTGMERNADVVMMASYAPLLVNVNWRQWNPDAIQYDNSRVCGTPSYYVQKMFAETRGDVVLPTEFDAPSMTVPCKGGAIGVGTWSTQAEFKDLQVTAADGELLFKSDFTKGIKGWRKIQGQWQVQDGVLRQTGPDQGGRLLAGDRKWKDYTYTLKARKLAGQEGFLILFNVQNDHAKSWWNIGGWGNQRHGLELDGVAGEAVSGHIETGRWYDIRIEVRGARIRCYLDGQLLHDVNPTVKSMFVVASRANRTGDVILKVVNAADEPRAAAIELAGLKGKVTSATANVLTSENPEDENTLDEPAKVVPVCSPIAGAGARFPHTFPAHSVSVLTVKVGQ